MWIFDPRGQHAYKPLRIRPEQASHSLLLHLAKWSMAEDYTTGNSWWLFRDLQESDSYADHYLSLSIYSLVYKTAAIITCSSDSVL